MIRTGRIGYAARYDTVSVGRASPSKPLTIRLTPVRMEIVAEIGDPVVRRRLPRLRTIGDPETAYNAPAPTTRRPNRPCAAPPHDASATGTRTRPIVIAHRGASGYRPERTLAAYELDHAVGVVQARK